MRLYKKNIKKNIIRALSASVLLSSAAICNAYTVAIVAPINIPAMHEIVNGFKSELNNGRKHKVHVIVKNAQGDQQLQQSIISEFSKQKSIDMIAPIGTSAFEMSAAYVRHKPILGIAAELTQAKRSKLHNQQTTDVVDEINVATQLRYLQEVIPHLKQVTILHSMDDKTEQEVKQFKHAASKYTTMYSHGKKNHATKGHPSYGPLHSAITVQDLPIPEASDLYSISRSVSNKSQAIFILKDEMIVSAMPSIVLQAERMGIPVVASDDGSVQSGAAFALGVHERAIGTRSAQIAKKIIAGTSAKNIPITPLTHYTVFVNPKHAVKQKVKLSRLRHIANKSGYKVEEFSTHG